MKFKIVKLEQFSGQSASVYSIYLEDEKTTLFEKFTKENFTSHQEEVKNIFSTLKVIGSKTGIRKQFIKDKEGAPGDGVCALFDNPDKHLRLYCIKYGVTIIILGGGGVKSKQIKALQEDEKLTNENYLLRKISQKIIERIKNQEIVYSDDYMNFEGDLEFYENDDYEN